MATTLENKFVTGYDRYAVEKRTPDGQLDFSAPQPPFIEATVNELCDYFFARSDFAGESASQEQIAKWYADQGFYYRVKTW